VRAEQLAYRLMVCAETLQHLGCVAKLQAPYLSPTATAMISCLYLESSCIYPALRDAAKATTTDQPDTWKWLRSIEHQDWLRSHLASLEGLARVLLLALEGDGTDPDSEHQPFIETSRLRELHDAQLSSAIKRFKLATKTCHLNLRTLALSCKDPWKYLPWKLFKPKEESEEVKWSPSAIYPWLNALGRKCGRQSIDTIVHDWDADRKLLVKSFLKDTPKETQLFEPQKQRRRSSVRWVDDEGGKLERGRSLLSIATALKQDLKQNGHVSPTGMHSSPTEAIADDLRQTKAILPISCTHQDCSKHAMQPPLFADQRSLAKHMKLSHNEASGSASADSAQDGLNWLHSHPRSSGHTLPRGRTVPEAYVTPPSRPSTPAIDIPRRRHRSSSHYSPHSLSPRPSTTIMALSLPYNRSLGHSPDTSTHVLDALNRTIKHDLQPQIFSLARQHLSSPSRSQSDPHQEQAYYNDLHRRLLKDDIKPAALIDTSLLDPDGRRQRSKIIDDAYGLIELLDEWTDEHAYEGNGCRSAHTRSVRVVDEGSRRARAFSMSPSCLTERKGWPFGRSY
jgi:hypothetical protein